MSSTTFPGLPQFAEGRSIPKIIHQTFPDHALPAAIEDNVQKMRLANPGWEYRLYDDEDIPRFIGTEYGAAVLARYQRINPKYGAARADLFRYLLMYKVGGAYFDIKASLERPLDAVIRADDRYLLSCWDNEAGQLHEGWGATRNCAISSAASFSNGSSWRRLVTHFYVPLSLMCCTISSVTVRFCTVRAYSGSSA